MHYTNHIIITLDGPSVSGKSTLAQLIATDLGYLCLHSGMLYRTLAYIMKEKNIVISSLTNECVQSLLAPEKLIFSLSGNNSGTLIYEGIDITSLLKTETMSHMASIISAIACVREIIKEILKKYASQQNIVAEGRDMGSIVFPHAAVKFFVTASPEIRAMRWQKIQKTLGLNYSLSESLIQLTQRDKRDATRSLAPLIKPANAHVIDTSTISAAIAAQQILHIINKTLG